MPIVREIDIVGSSRSSARSFSQSPESSSTCTGSGSFLADVVGYSGEFVIRIPLRWGTDASRFLWSSGVEKTPGVCGGAARIARTRIPVWTLVRFKQLGASDEDLLSFYPALTREKLARAWQYAGAHQDEIAAEILQNEA